MAELKAVLDESLSGHGQMAMVAGEPGIGKTRAASELANYAQALGAQVIWGWCYVGRRRASLLALDTINQVIRERRHRRSTCL